ncbi:AbiH family protein [Pseudoalteromonas sp. B137]
MTTLVILGNGFDMWHGLPTAYSNFYNQYNQVLEEYIHYFNDFCDIDSEWANFEESLGSFDEDNFHDNSAWQPSLEELAENHKLLYGFEDEISNNIEELVSEITTAFKSWIRSIRVSTATKLIEFPKKFKFISFNYTTTLQDVYRIPDKNILHIHGKVERNIIFGHGRCNNASKNISEDNEPWFHESRKSSSSVYSGV